MTTIFGTLGNDSLYGTGSDDNIFGLTGNDKLHYGSSWGDYEAHSGNDHLFGGAGNDTLSFYEYVETYDPVPDIFVDLASGTAELEGGVTLELSGIENVTFWGDWGFEAWGDQSANRLTAEYGWGAFHGRAGNDLLEGGHGDDQFYGDEGDDTLVGGDGNDTLTGGAGTDTVEFVALSAQDIHVDLGAGTASGEGDDLLSEIENATTSAGSDWLGGSDVANNLIAGAGNDVAYGLGGNDQIDGSAGNDTLEGGAGNDTLKGGTGFDVLKGGTGIDTLTGFHHADDFVFAPGDSSIGAGFRDVVTDFSTVQGDDLDLTAFGGLAFVGQSVFSAPDQVRFIHSGGNTLVQLNTVGSSGMEMEVQLNGIVNLGAVDFLL